MKVKRKVSPGKDSFSVLISYFHCKFDGNLIFLQILHGLRYWAAIRNTTSYVQMSRTSSSYSQFKVYPLNGDFNSL